MEDTNKQPEKSAQARRQEEQLQRLTEAMRRDVKVFDRIVKGRRPGAKEQGNR